jgi:hypothetical protein
MGWEKFRQATSANHTAYVQKTLRRMFPSYGGNFVGAAERTRTSTVLLPPAPQAGASASSATAAAQPFSHVWAKNVNPQMTKVAAEKNYLEGS